MDRTPFPTAAFLVGAALAGVLAADEKGKPAIEAREGVVATLGEQRITDGQLEELAKDRLMRLRSEEYHIKKQVLEEYITRSLLEKEAKARGVSVQDLQKTEIDAKILPVTEEQKRAVFESAPQQQFAGKSEAEAFSLIEANLKRVRMAEARNRFLSSLRAKTSVKIMLEPPRLAIAPGPHPSLGPAEAPVTIVEFSDFQCPACGRAFPTIKQLVQRYPGKVRLVFRDFPLAIHPLAPKAAEAAACAQEQGKFWEMHDRMFQNQQKLAIADLKASAAELGMDPGKFGSCLDSSKFAADWQNDMSEARRYGVSATPTFFINGRMVQGSQPLQSFVDIVEEELARSAAPVAASR